MSAPAGGGHQARLHSGAALFTFDAGQRIRSWNKGAEEATGIAADQVAGRYCWEVLCGRDEAGRTVCHAGCSFHRLLCARWPVVPPTLTIKTATGSRRVRVPMITLDDGALFAALLVDAGESPVPARSLGPEAVRPSLTLRQHTVLAMLADGKPARRIAAELLLSEMTVRNHIRALLREFGCNSQLSAVAEARRLGLV